MKLVCTLCGREKELTQWHRDCSRSQPRDATYVCEPCSMRVRYEAKRAQETPKPL